MQAQNDFMWKLSSRKLKEGLLEARAVLQSTLQMVDDLLKENCDDVDLDETFFEPAEREAAAAKTALEKDGELAQKPSAKIAAVSDDESEAESYNPPRSSTPEKHICKLPRCWLHQPFRATDKEIKGLSLQEVKLRSKEPAYTPKGFWDLDI